MVAGVVEPTLHGSFAMAARAWFLVILSLGCSQAPRRQAPFVPPEPVLLQPVKFQEEPKTAFIPVSKTSVDETSVWRDRFAQAFAQMPTYSMQMRRREVVAGAKAKEEVIQATFRQQPHSVHLKWVGEEAKQREVVFVAGQYQNKIHTLLGKGDAPLPFLFGTRFDIDSESPMVKDKSRYRIADAGLGSALKRYEKALAEGRLTVGGKVARPEFPQTIDVVHETIPAGHPLFLKGGKRAWHFGATGLPVLILAVDHTGSEVEYYLHEEIRSPLAVGDDDFNPDKLFKK